MVAWNLTSKNSSDSKAFGCGQLMHQPQMGRGGGGGGRGGGGQRQPHCHVRLQTECSSSRGDMEMNGGSCADDGMEPDQQEQQQPTQSALTERPAVGAE